MGRRVPGSPKALAAAFVLSKAVSRTARLARPMNSLVAVVALSMAGSCSPPQAKDRAVVPISTSSAAARNAYLAGRDLMEKQRTTDGRRYFLAAVEADP